MSSQVMKYAIDWLIDVVLQIIGALGGFIGAMFNAAHKRMAMYGPLIVIFVDTILFSLAKPVIS